MGIIWGKLYENKILVITFPLLVLVLIAMVPISSATTATLTIVSDTTTQWWNGAEWQQAVACWVFPWFGGWPSLPGATYIWKSYMVTQEEAYNGTPPITFRKIFTIPETATEINGSIRITADNAYELYLNGKLIGKEGVLVPMPPDYNIRQWDWLTIETYPFIPKPGENEIKIIVINYAQPYSWANPYSNPAGLIYRADISYIIQDTDSDGIPDEEDNCPFEDATGYDANNDGCIDDVCDLSEVVKSHNLHEGIENSLVFKAENACKKLQEKKIKPAKGILDAFISEVKSQKGKKIPTDIADMLVQFVKNVKSLL